MPESLTGLIKDISILIAFFAVFCTAFSAIIVAKIQSKTQLKAKSMDLYFDSKFSAYREFISANMELQTMLKYAIPLDDGNYKIESLLYKHEEYLPKLYEAIMKVERASAAASLLANPVLNLLMDSYAQETFFISQELIILDDEHEIIDKDYYNEKIKESNLLLNNLIEQMQEDLFIYDYKRKRNIKKCLTS